MKIDNLGELKSDFILPYSGVYKKRKHIAIDTETVRGLPYTIQFYNGKNVELHYVTKDTITDVYLDYLEREFEDDMSLWAFYIQFDLPIIFYNLKEIFCYASTKFQMGNHFNEVVSEKTWFINSQYHGSNYFFRDAYQFVFRGMGKVAEDLCLTHLKKDRPTWLGERVPKEDERAMFEEYAKQDVITLYELVQWIDNIHKEYDVGLSVSLADLCGKIFRKKFFMFFHELPPLTSEVLIPSLLSYHGGKTECYVDTPTLVKGIKEYDVISAYPYAMSQMPNFFNCEIKPTKKVIENPAAVYKINIQHHCHYRPLYSHDFKYSRVLSETWVTGYELLSMLQYDKFDYEVIQGYEVIGKNNQPNPLYDYVWHFFEKKNKADIEGNKTDRLFAKLALNSLYGKFISRHFVEDGNIQYWKSGVLFHPLMATLVTGYVRAYIHGIEHDCNSLHTSTDSVITQNSLDGEYGNKGLGALKLEYEGDCLILRRKMYIIFDKLVDNCKHLWLEKGGVTLCNRCGSKVLKAALHGFFGDTVQLLRMYEEKKQFYIFKRMVRLKEARISRDPDKIPFLFQNFDRKINIEWENLQVIERKN